MAYDGIVVNAITQELGEVLTDGRIDKIHQPEKDTILISVRTRNGGYRLLLCANPSCARVHLASSGMENPMTPPMFCMLLRKHIGSGKITRIEQPDFERIIRIHIESYDELGDLSEKVLICELMGKHSNIILINKDGKIIDSVYHIDLSVSSVRQILPGLIYTAPPAQDKLNPTEYSKDDVKKRLMPDDSPLYKQLLDTYSGISPLMAREAVYRACGDIDKIASDASGEETDKTAYVFSKMMENTAKGEFEPCMVSDSESGKLIDFNALAITQYESLGEVTFFETVNEAAEAFYYQKSSMQSLKQKGSDLMKFVNNNLERCLKKLQLEKEILEKAKKKEKYKIYGDLITANIYRINPGDKVLECQNFYSEGMENVKIPLNEDLTPSKNAQKYYTKYTKQKTAEAETEKQKELNLKEIDYLESVKEAIELAESGAEIALIREELTDQGYLRQRYSKRPKKKALPTPMHFVSDDGYDIYVGKNNTQNDYVTFKLSRSTDIWFHTKSIHGSHTIIRTPDAMEVPDRTYLQAASIAAYYSRARSSKSVPVDYTEVKNVKKPNGAKPGMVIYVDYNTIYANPDEELVKRLKK